MYGYKKNKNMYLIVNLFEFKIFPNDYNNYGFKYFKYFIGFNL